MKLDYKHFMESKKAKEDLMYMEMALAAATQAGSHGDQARGAVLAFPGRHFADWNTCHSERCAVNHAEINVLRKAESMVRDRVASTTGRPFSEAVLYCTVEPCAMCAATAAEYGVSEIIFGAYDPVDGFVSSPDRGIKAEAFDITWRGGVLADRCVKSLPMSLREHLLTDPVR